MKHRGFTLLEVLLVIGIMLIVFTISVPVMMPTQRRMELYVNQQMAENMYRRAQILAQHGVQDSEWGVRLESTQLILFSGSSYDTRTPSLDEINTLPVNVTAMGPEEIVFSKIYGIPNNNGTVTLTSTINQAVLITINAKGAID